MAEDTGLTKQVATSAFWRVAKVGVDNVLRFATFVVFARVLTPTDFGVFAVATFFIQIAQTISKSGFPDALRREKVPDEEFKSTLFWANLVLSLLVSLCLVAISPLLTYWTTDHRIVPILSVLSLTLMIQPFGFVNVAMADREFKQRLIVTLSGTASAVSSVAAIAAAYSGFGLWSLVIQSLVLNVMTVALMAWRFPWKPSFRFSWPRLKATLGFSVNLLVAQLQITLITRMQELIATTFINLAAVGIYRVGYRFMELIGQAFISPLVGLGLISFSRMQDDDERLARAYLRMVSATSIIYCPVMLGFAGVAPDAVPLLFGHKWQQSVSVVQILSLLSPILILSYFSTPALAAKGRTDVVRRIVTLQLVGTLVFSLIGVRFGVDGLAAGYVLRSYATLPKQMRWLREATGVEPMKGLGAALKPAACALAMAIIVYALRGPLAHAVAHPLLRLAASCMIGAVLYPALMLLFFRSFFLEQITDFRKIFERPAKTAMA